MGEMQVQELMNTPALDIQLLSMEIHQEVTPSGWQAMEKMKENGISMLSMVTMFALTASMWKATTINALVIPTLEILMPPLIMETLPEVGDSGCTLLICHWQTQFGISEWAHAHSHNCLKKEEMEFWNSNAQDTESRLNEKLVEIKKTDWLII